MHVVHAAWPNPHTSTEALFIARPTTPAVGTRSCDYVGNLTYMLSATNFNPIMALAGAVVIAEPEEIVPVGMIPPDAVKTPGVLVDHVIRRAA